MVRLFTAYCAFPSSGFLLPPSASPSLAVSVSGVVLALSLFTAELREYVAAPRRHDMSVHMERNEELPLKLRLSFTNMPCSLINVDVVDDVNVVVDVIVNIL